MILKTGIKVSMILIGIAIFLLLPFPFFIAPKAYYNGLPNLTNFIALSILLGFVFIVAGTLYFIFERGAEKHQQASRSNV